MAVLIRIPRLYPEMEEATVGHWHATEGAAVAPRAPVVEIITDKVSYDIEAPDDPAESILLVCCTPEKAVLPVDSIIAIIGRTGESSASLPDWRAENADLATKHQAQLQAGSGQAAPATVGTAPAASGAAAPAGIIRATPAARRAARTAGVTLEDVVLSATGSTITEADVETFVRRRQQP